MFMRIFDLTMQRTMAAQAGQISRWANIQHNELMEKAIKHRQFLQMLGLNRRLVLGEIRN
jgi:hypothetical protein